MLRMSLLILGGRVLREWQGKAELPRRAVHALAKLANEVIAVSVTNHHGNRFHAETGFS